ncbi:hypothetical protein [Microcystis phage Mae-JY22]
MQWAWDAADVQGHDCPVLLMHEAAAVLESHRWMERGFLPRDGGWRAQEAWWLSAIEALEVGTSHAKAQLQAARERPDGGE